MEFFEIHAINLKGDRFFQLTNLSFDIDKLFQMFPPFIAAFLSQTWKEVHYKCYKKYYKNDPKHLEIRFPPMLFSRTFFAQTIPIRLYSQSLLLPQDLERILLWDSLFSVISTVVNPWGMDWERSIGVCL